MLRQARNGPGDGPGPMPFAPWVSGVLEGLDREVLGLAVLGFGKEDRLMREWDLDVAGVEHLLEHAVIGAADAPLPTRYAFDPGAQHHRAVAEAVDAEPFDIVEDAAGLFGIGAQLFEGVQHG